MLDKPSERQAQLVRMTELFPTGHPELWNGLFQDLLSRGVYDELYKYFPQALKQYPHEGSLFLFKSLAEETSGDLELAKRTALQGIAQADTTQTEVLSDLYGQVGDLCVAQHKNQDAMAAYEESIKLNEKNATALNNYAYFLLGLEQPALIEKAVRLASKAVALHPNDFRLLDTYGFALFLQRDYLKRGSIECQHSQPCRVLLPLCKGARRSGQPTNKSSLSSESKTTCLYGRD